MPAIELTPTPCPNAIGLPAQRLAIAIATADKLVQPEDLKHLHWHGRPEPGLGIVLDGRAPNWVLAGLAPLCRQFAVPWIAMYEPRLHAGVVIESDLPALRPGELIPLGDVKPEQSPSQECLLEVREVACRNAATYQRLEILVPEAVNTAVLRDLVLPAGLDLGRGVVLWGRAPLWLFARLTLLCAAAPWTGVYNKPLGSYVIVDRQPGAGPALGDAFHVGSGATSKAILIGGPPNSGKSVLADSLARALRRKFGPDIHLQRAHADGEGDWFVEMYANAELQARADALRKSAKAKYTDRFFLHHSAAVQNARESSRLVLVDFGGVTNNADAPLLHRCTHYILISSSAEKLPEWHEFCANRGGLVCLAVVHSTLEARCETVSREPYLEMIAGPWNRGQEAVPDAMIEVAGGVVSPAA